MEKKIRRTDLETKKKIIQQIETKEISVMEAARELGVNPATIGRWLERIGRKIDEKEYLFQPGKNIYDGKVIKKLSHSAVGYIVKKWAKKINKDKRITPHSARATFISSLIDNGEDIYYVSQLVNHADVRMTQRYNKRKRTFRRNPVFNLNFF